MNTNSVIIWYDQADCSKGHNNDGQVFQDMVHCEKKIINNVDPSYGRSDIKQASFTPEFKLHAFSFTVQYVVSVYFSKA